MNKNIRSKKLSSYPDEWDFEAVFPRLQEYPDKLQSKRLEHVLELLNGLGSGHQKPGPLLQGLAKALSGYTWVTRVMLTSEGFRAIWFPADQHKLTSDDAWEYSAVRLLLELLRVPAGLSRLRRCAYCERWLFAAKRSDQKFCKTGVCRQNHYVADLTHREKHREAVRAYDKREAESGRRAKETAIAQLAKIRRTKKKSA